jgi:hypothetical protein
MNARSLFASLTVIAIFVAFGSATAGARAQGPALTLVGEWIVKSQPINGQNFSRKGNTLGFPDRDMFFFDDAGLRTGMVVREDVGANVKPLGVWRVEGSNLSTAFELWCPDSSGPCGSVIMRGSFSDPNTISGTMSVFFEVEDDTTPTGLDTWVFSFTGTRK